MTLCNHLKKLIDERAKEQLQEELIQDVAN